MHHPEGDRIGLLRAEHDVPSQEGDELRQRIRAPLGLHDRRPRGPSLEQQPLLFWRQSLLPQHAQEVGEVVAVAARGLELEHPHLRRDRGQIARHLPGSLPPRLIGVEDQHHLALGKALAPLALPACRPR
jgi:hypothetical protein